MQKATNTHKAFLSAEEARKHLGLGRDLFRDLVRKGKLPVIVVGNRKRLYDPAALVHAMKQMEEGGVTWR